MPPQRSYSIPRPPVRALTFSDEAGQQQQKTPADRRSSTRAKEVISKILASKSLTSPPVQLKPYSYGRIRHNEEIRILRIQPGNRDSEIQCELHTTALILQGSAPSLVRYTALSYWWGKPDEVPRHKIRIFHERRPDDEPKWGSFKIRDNLNAALQKLRHQTEMRDIWVDAICIDQNHNEEKKAQVSRMHEVYTQAEHVCVWLGKDEPTPTAEDTFKFLIETLNLRNLDILVEEPDKDSTDNWKKVVSLMSKEWFTRRWIIQELALSRRASVHYGDADLEWSSFADAIALFMTKYHTIRQKSLDPLSSHYVVDARAFGANTIIHATTNMFRKSREGYVEERLLSLEVLVTSMLVAFEAGEPRDTIFAVLTLANDTHFAGTNKHDPRIAPSYEKDLLDVYIDFIDYCIETSQSLDVICRHWAALPITNIGVVHKANSSHSSRVPAGMPTWIPWINGSAFGKPSQIQRGRLHGDAIVGKLDRKGQHTYNASSGLKPWYQFGELEIGEIEFQPPLLQKTSTFSDLRKKLARKRKPTNLQSFAEMTPPQPVTTRIRRPQLQPSPSSFVPKKHDGTLRVRGFSVGTIDQISERMSGEGVIPAEALAMGGWNFDINPAIADQQDVPDRLWRTMVANRGSNGTTAPAWYRRACLECLQPANLSHHNDLSIASLKQRRDPSTPSTMILFLDRVQETVFNRRFFTTTPNSGTQKTQIFGLGSKWVHRGDIICILFGCSVPVILREVDEPDNYHHEFIGECYAHGVMEGEACSDTLPDWPDCLDWPYNLPKPRDENFIKKYLLK